MRGDGDAQIARSVTDQERRARIGVRHALAGSSRLGSPEGAARAMVCLHATDPPSIHLSCWARIGALSVEDVERALYDARSLIRQQSMRDTLFAIPRELIPPSGEARPLAWPWHTATDSSKTWSVQGQFGPGKARPGWQPQSAPFLTTSPTVSRGPPPNCGRKCRRSAESSNRHRARPGVAGWRLPRGCLPN